MSTVADYFCPYTKPFQEAIQDFLQIDEQDWPTLKKAAVIGLSILGGIVSLFILGLGALPAFRWGVSLFKEIKSLSLEIPLDLNENVVENSQELQVTKNEKEEKLADKREAIRLKREEFAKRRKEILQRQSASQEKIARLKSSLEERKNSPSSSPKKSLQK